MSAAPNAAYCQWCGPIRDTYRDPGDPPDAAYCAHCGRPAEPCPATAFHTRSGNVGIGDLVISDGSYTTVVAVAVHEPGQHPPGSPIRPDYTALEVATLEVDGREGTRWVGAERAHIGADLRVEWWRP